MIDILTALKECAENENAHLTRQECKDLVAVMEFIRRDMPHVFMEKQHGHD